MGISTVREFRDKATARYDASDRTQKRELYETLSSDVARRLKRRKVSEDDVVKGFEASRKKRRVARRRR